MKLVSWDCVCPMLLDDSLAVRLASGVFRGLKILEIMLQSRGSWAYYPARMPPRRVQ
jgi:hypothetical protein